MWRRVLTGLDSHPKRNLLIGIFSFALGTAYLLLKIYSVSGNAGYDFRYIWAAARVWNSGLSPYSEAFRDFSVRAITEGNVPDIWNYPPNWWPISILLATDDILTANLAFNLATLAMLLASALIVGAFAAQLLLARHGSGDSPERRSGIFALQGLMFLSLAAMEATAILLSSGQTSVLALFGAALVLQGQRHPSATLRIARFALLFLKPQIGLPFAAAHLVLSSGGFRDLLAAGIVAALMALPAFLVDPGTVRGFLDNAGAYQGVNIVNTPPGMTGLGSAVYSLTGYDTGYLLPLAAACLLAIFFSAQVRQTRPREATGVSLSALSTICLAPLHYYDFVLVLLVLPLAVLMTGRLLVVFLLGFALMFRADTLGSITGFYDHGVGVFEGSWLSTIGATLMTVAAWPQSSRTIDMATVRDSAE